jgi:uncharacterized protein (TIGR03437 family)
VEETFVNIRILLRKFLLAVAVLVVAGLPLPFPGEKAVSLFVMSASAQTVTAVNAASYAQDKKLTPNSIAAAFAAVNTQNGQSFQASSLPLPTLMGGCSVTIGGQPAGLFFVGPTQINLLIPANAPTGTNIPIVITQANSAQISGTVNIEPTAPGLFSAASTGAGVAAALTTFDGATYRPVFQVSGNQLVELPITDAGTPSRPNILVLYGTGIRGAQLSNVIVTIQGVPATVQYAGPVAGNEGLDQINAIIPPELAGFSNLNIAGTSTPFGALKVKVTIGSNVSNTVTINIGGSAQAFRPQTISANQLINGTLAASDQIELDNAATLSNGQANPNFGNTYFIDTYTFRGAPGLNIAVDMRSTQFDAALTLYRIDAASGNSLRFVASDDITGQLGNGTIEAGKNPLLLAVIPDSSDYIIFATSADRAPNATGSYSIQMRTNVIQPITYGTTNFAGSIANTDLLTSGGVRPNGQNATGTYLDVFSFSGAAGDNVRVSTTSSAFAPYLILQQNDGDFIAEDQNSGLLQTATVNQVLPDTQVYIVIITPLTTNLTGNYTVTLTRLNAQNQPEESLLHSILQPESGSFLGRMAGRDPLIRDEAHRNTVRSGRTASGRSVQ